MTVNSDSGSDSEVDGRIDGLGRYMIRSSGLDQTIEAPDHRMMGWMNMNMNTHTHLIAALPEIHLFKDLDQRLRLARRRRIEIDIDGRRVETRVVPCEGRGGGG